MKMPNGNVFSVQLLDPDRECIASTTVLRVPETCYSATEDSTQGKSFWIFNFVYDVINPNLGLSITIVNETACAYILDNFWCSTKQ